MEKLPMGSRAGAKGRRGRDGKNDRGHERDGRPLKLVWREGAPQWPRQRWTPFHLPGAASMPEGLMTAD
jgi:hypothetical protein